MSHSSLFFINDFVKLITVMYLVVQDDVAGGLEALPIFETVAAPHSLVEAEDSDQAILGMY